MIDLGLDLYRTIGRCADRLGIDAYAVGGVVRDFFLGRPCTDIDVVCVGREEGGEVHIGIELAKASSEALGGSKVSVFKNFGTASFRYTPGHEERREEREYGRVTAETAASPLWRTGRWKTTRGGATSRSTRWPYASTPTATAS